MFRYDFLGGNVVSVNLCNGYSIIAISKRNKDENCYYSTLYIKGDTYDTLDLIEEKEKFVVHADIKDIAVKVTEMITDWFEKGFFDRYIRRYKFMMKCFDYGNEYFEKNNLVDSEFNLSE